MLTLFSPDQLRTLTLFASAVHLGIGLLLGLTWKTRRTGSGFACWVFTELCIGGAWLLILLQSFNPQQYLPVAYTLLLLLSPALYAYGCRQFYGMPASGFRFGGIRMALLFSFIYALAVANGANLHERIVIFSATQAILLFSLTCLIWQIGNRFREYRIIWLLVIALGLQTLTQCLRLHDHWLADTISGGQLGNNPLADSKVGALLMFSILFSLLRSSIDLIVVQIRTEQALTTSMQQLEQRANIDSLTGLATRHFMDASLPALRQRCMRNDGKLALLLFDIDHFKTVNDTHGHPIGDGVLAAVATVVRQHSRADDMAIRLGGDEIAILVCNCNDIELRGMLTRLRESLRTTCLELTGLTVTISAGIAMFEQDESFEQVYRHADQAMYMAKNHGRNCVYVHTQQQQAIRLELGDEKYSLLSC